jgi:hypothetical protein
MTSSQTNNNKKSNNKAIAIVQSSYIPWKGYFNMVDSVQEFVILDDIQYTRRDWRNRNRIKSRNGPLWLTIPVHSREHRNQRIMDIRVADPAWNKRHWETIRHCYGRAPYFHEFKDFLESLYLDRQPDHLSGINVRFIKNLCKVLGISTLIRWSSEFEKRGEKSLRLLDICKSLGAGIYYTGWSAGGYLNERPFLDSGIEVRYCRHIGYPQYTQMHPHFDHHVSIIDLLLNTGPEARRYIKCLEPEPLGFSPGQTIGV